MTFWAAVIGCVLIVLMSYLLGYKRSRAWGKPVLIAAAALLLLAVLDRAVLGVVFREALRGPDDSSSRLVNASATAGELIGKELRGKVAGDAGVLFLEPFAPDRRQGWPTVVTPFKEGFARALDASGWRDAGYFGPANLPADALSRGLAAERFDVLVSMAGLGEDFGSASLGAGKPVVAAYFPRNTAAPAQVRQWLEQRSLQVAVMHRADNDRLEVFTPERLPEVIAAASGS